MVGKPRHVLPKVLGIWGCPMEAELLLCLIKIYSLSYSQFTWVHRTNPTSSFRDGYKTYGILIPLAKVTRSGVGKVSQANLMRIIQDFGWKHQEKEALFQRVLLSSENTYLAFLLFLVENLHENEGNTKGSCAETATQRPSLDDTV